MGDAYVQLLFARLSGLFHFIYSLRLSRWTSNRFLFPHPLFTAVILIPLRFIGSKDEPELKNAFKQLSEVVFTHFPSADTATTGGYKNTFELFKFKLEYIIPVPYLPVMDTYAGGVPSVSVSHESVMNGKMSAAILESLEACLATAVCTELQMYHDITGNVGSVQDANVAVGPGMRTGLIHLVLGLSVSMDSWYALGESSYFSESAYSMADWQNRLA